MFEQGSAVIRNLLEGFEKIDGSRSNCPRCSGSGLFHGQKSWSRDRTPYHDFCWFCEGVGVMPLYGLSGFFLGRASASFRTENLRKPVASPFRLELCLGKYPETKCKIRAFKPSGKMQELLYNRSEGPSWLVDASEELAAESVVLNQGYDEDTDLIMCHEGEGSASSQTAILKSSISSLKASKLPSYYDRDLDITGNSFAQMVQASVSGVLARFNKIDWISPLDWGTEKKKMVAVPSSMLKSNSPYAKEFLILEKAQVKETITELGKRKSNSRRTRLARQNRIRKKAEREARDRVRRLPRLKPSSSEQPTSSIPTNETGDNWAFSSNWKEVSSHWLAEETALVRQAIRSAQSEAQESPKLHSVDQVLFARLVNKLAFLPNFVWPLKWY